MAQTLHVREHTPNEPDGEQKPWLVLLHPTPVDHHFWLPSADVFAQSYRLLMPDLPGHGGSVLQAGKWNGEPLSMQTMASAVLRAMDERGIERAAFCGCSIGGYLLYELWRQAPERMRAVVIVSAKPHADSEEGRRTREQTVSTIAAQGTAPFFDASLQALVGEPARREDPQIDQRLRQIMERMPAESAIAVQRALKERPDSRPTAATIRVPTAVLAGALDRVSTPAELRELADLVPGAAYFLLQDMGHYAPFEQPRLVGALVRRFLDDQL